MNRTMRIQRKAPQDRELWQKLYYRYPQQSKRRRLLALQALAVGAGKCGKKQDLNIPLEFSTGMKRFMVEFRKVDRVSAC